MGTERQHCVCVGGKRGLRHAAVAKASKTRNNSYCRFFDKNRLERWKGLERGKGSRDRRGSRGGFGVSAQGRSRGREATEGRG